VLVQAAIGGAAVGVAVGIFTVTQPRIRNCPANAERWWRQGGIPVWVSMVAFFVWEVGRR
jgi:hypothetical protein